MTDGRTPSGRARPRVRACAPTSDSAPARHARGNGVLRGPGSVLTLGRGRGWWRRRSRRTAAQRAAPAWWRACLSECCLLCLPLVPLVPLAPLAPLVPLAGAAGAAGTAGAAGAAGADAGHCSSARSCSLACSAEPSHAHSRTTRGPRSAPARRAKGLVVVCGSGSLGAQPQAQAQAGGR